MTHGSTSSSRGPLVLAIDAASAVPGLALCRGEALLGEIHLRGPLAHAENILVEIGALLERVGVTARELAALGVTLGPGSFTGVRIGLATARGLSMATGAPVYGLSTLMALALKHPWAAPPVVPLIDPRRGSVYTATWDCAGGAPRLLDEERLAPIPALIAGLVAPTLFVGDGAAALAPLLRERLGEGALFASGAGAEGVAGVAAGWIAARVAAGDAPAQAELSPRYLQPSAAETNAG